MSIYKLVNNTGSDVQLDWCYGYTFPNSTSVDLITDVGLNVEDLIGVSAGDYYDYIVDLLDTGNWKLNNGKRNYYYDEAIYLLTNGVLAGYKLEGVAKTVVSHDLCFSHTWYQNPSKVVDDVLKRVDNYYKTSFENLICADKGFIYQEDFISAQQDFNVKVNDVVVDSSNYSVDSIKGRITFNDGFIANPETDIVKCTYDYGKSSIFEVKTDNNYLWRILKTEIQLASDVVIETPLIMEIIIDHPLAGDNYVASRWVYKSVRDLISGSNLGFSVPSFGGTNTDAGYTGEIIILPFNYTVPSELPIGLNARIRIRNEGDIPISGKFGTATFYMDKIKL